MAIDSAQRVHVLWPTPVDGKDMNRMGIFSPIIAWDEVVDGTRRLGFARVSSDASGAVTFKPIVSPDPSAGQWYPALASNGAGAVAVWVRQQEKGSAIGVARVQ